jgi:hypothetical protein
MNARQLVYINAKIQVSKKPYKENYIAIESVKRAIKPYILLYLLLFLYLQNSVQSVQNRKIGTFISQIKNLSTVQKVSKTVQTVQSPKNLDTLDSVVQKKAYKIRGAL